MIRRPRGTECGPPGFGVALSDGLAGNGKAVLLAMQIWTEDVVCVRPSGGRGGEG